MGSFYEVQKMLFVAFNDGRISAKEHDVLEKSIVERDMQIKELEYHLVASQGMTNLYREAWQQAQESKGKGVVK